MSDYISRADAIEAVNMLDMFPPTKDAVARELMALPSADAEQVWIPCSERLPEEDTPVLVAVKTKDRLPKWIEKQTYHYVNDIDVWDADGGWYRNKRKVVAWQPLPTPYKGGDDE